MATNGVVLTLSDFKTPYLTCSRCNSVTFINVQRVRPKDAAKSPRTLELYEQLPHCSGCGSTKYMRAGVVSFQEKIAEEQQAVKEFERRRLPAVALIQRIARGYLGRRHFRRVKLDYEHHVLMLNQSAQLIQTHVRGMQARRRIIIERCLNIIKRMHPSILRHARTIWPNRPPVFWYDNPAELKIFYWNYREFVRRAGGRPTLIKVESNVMEITRRMLLREHALVSRIQARWRGITTRMVFHEYKRQCAWWRGLRQSPAIRIQRAFKGHRSKKRCQALRIKAQYPGLKEKYKHERLVVAQRQQAVALRAKLLTKYRHEYQVDKTTRMLALPANKYAVAAPAGAAAKVLDGDNNDSAESTVAVDTTHSLRRSTPDDAAVGSPVRVSVRSPPAMSMTVDTSSDAATAEQHRAEIVECALGRGDKRRHMSSIDIVSSANFPQQVNALRGHDVVAVSCGSRHTMVLTARGEVYSWGWGTMGQLGHGDVKSHSAPQKIEFFTRHNLLVDYISCGGCHSGAVTKDGSVYMWGEAHWGQLGLPEEFKDAHQSSPAKCPVVPSDSNEVVVKLSCDKGHVYMWGRCDSGQLGIGQEWLHESDGAGTLGVNRPHRVEGFEGEKIVQVACGAFHSAAVSDSGRVFIWGKEDYGMLGVGQTSDIQTPQRIPFFDNVPALRVSCGGWHTVVVTKAGACYSFGRGEYGRLGLGDTRSRYKPALVEALKNKVIVQAACGGSHTLFLTADGVAFSVGRVDHGRLGHPDMSPSLVPEPLDQVSIGSIPVRQISAGGAHSVALMHTTRKLMSPLIAPLPTTEVQKCEL
ncbi:TPA: hypothetical protein N0F65_001788 [Lagenidium giganteum]|uniref:RCC1-like domain-containing protein n=1 Tax=Lagenidium giganteum TaxID=4803 RepID=A0AAV2Z2U0_9STRA|nr:TPA: hypothetical protein N0F65_001788 [Lagenidium giganteum]